jgi:hypothetical protein
MFFAVAQGNALARGFLFAAQPETSAATAHNIAQRVFGEMRDNVCEMRVAMFDLHAASRDAGALWRRDDATRTLSKMCEAVSIVWKRISGRERQLDPERGSAADLRSKVYRTVVKLNNSEGARESDPASARPGRKK